MSRGRAMIFVILVAVYFKFVSYAQQARIIVPPESVNVELNKSVTLTCTAIAEDIRWKVNGSPTTPDLRNRGFDDSLPLTPVNVTQNLHKRTMRVFGSAENNNTNISCLAVFFIPVSVDENEVALLIFKPGSQQISNLAVILINSTTVLISWSPPSTLEGVPILGYNVTITNTTSGENETLLVEDTTLLYSIDYPDLENNFTVTVVPINNVGAGQPANSEPFLFHLPEFEGLHDYFSWLGSPLDVTFSSLKTCLNFALSRNGKGMNIDPEYVGVGDRKIVTFSIPMVTEDYSNATMTVQGEIGGSLCYKNFTVFTQDTVGPVLKMNYSNNCTFTTVHWQPPVTLGQLNVSYYYYQLFWNQSEINKGVTTDTFVSFNTSTLKPNVPGYSVLVWAHTPPGNGTSMDLSVVATEDPRVDFSYDVTFEANGTCTVTLKLMVNESCSSAHPTKGFISVVMGSSRQVNRSFPISFNSNGTDVVHIDSLEVGHSECRAVVVFENLSGGTLVDNFTFSTAVNSTQSISPTPALTPTPIQRTAVNSTQSISPTPALTPTPIQTPGNNPDGCSVSPADNVVFFDSSNYMFTHPYNSSPSTGVGNMTLFIRQQYITDNLGNVSSLNLSLAFASGNGALLVDGLVTPERGYSLDNDAVLEIGGEGRQWRPSTGSFVINSADYNICSSGNTSYWSIPVVFLLTKGPRTVGTRRWVVEVSSIANSITEVDLFNFTSPTIDVVTNPIKGCGPDQHYIFSSSSCVSSCPCGTKPFQYFCLEGLQGFLNQTVITTLNVSSNSTNVPIYTYYLLFDPNLYYHNDQNKVTKVSITVQYVGIKMEGTDQLMRPHDVQLIFEPFVSIPGTAFAQIGSSLVIHRLRSIDSSMLESCSYSNGSYDILPIKVPLVTSSLYQLGEHVVIVSGRLTIMHMMPTMIPAIPILGQLQLVVQPDTSCTNVFKQLFDLVEQECVSDCSCGDVAFRITSTPYCESDPIYGVPTEEEREEIAHTVQHKWRLIGPGLQLGIDEDGIAEDFSPDNHAQCSFELFRRWATNELSADCPFMWDKLIEILDGSLVQETTLARELKKESGACNN